MRDAPQAEVQGRCRLSTATKPRNGGKAENVCPLWRARPTTKKIRNENKVLSCFLSTHEAPPACWRAHTAAVQALAKR